MRLNSTVAILMALALAPGCARPLRPDPSGAAASEAQVAAGMDTLQLSAGIPPTTWWSGPDPSRWPISTDGEGGRSVDVADWSRFLTVPAWPPDGRPYFGPDSFRYIPVARRPVGENFERRTFYEVYGDRIYARSEGDTVHLNSWVVLCNGGHDKDSKYTPRVDPSDPGLPPGFMADPVTYAVLHSLGYVGSPIGFRSRITTKLAGGMLVQPPLSGLYPVFDPYSVFRMPQLAGYHRIVFEGKAYAAAGAEDSNGRKDVAALSDAVGIADRVDAGGGTPQDRIARRRIIVFYVRSTP